MSSNLRNFSYKYILIFYKNFLYQKLRCKDNVNVVKLQSLKWYAKNHIIINGKK